MKRALVIGLGLLATASCSQSPDAVKREALNRAEQYQSQGKLDEAIIEWRQALAVDPALVEARHALGRAYRQLVAERPTDASALAGLGQVVLRQRRDGEAAALLEQADALRPGDPRIRIHLSEARVRLGRLPDATRTLEEIHPRARSSAAAVALGWCYLRAHPAREATVLLAPLVEQLPRWVELRLLLGTSYLVSGNAAAAVTELEQADRQSAADPLVRMRLAAAYTRVGRPQDALHPLGSLGAAAQALPDFQLERSRALLRLWRLDEASVSATAAQRTIPQAPQPC